MESLKSALTCQSVRGHLQQIEKHLDEFNYVLARSALNELACVMGHDLMEDVL